MSSVFNPVGATVVRATEADYRPLVDHWTAVFEQPAIVFEAMYDSADPSTRFGFLIRDGDTIVSAVQTYILPLRDEAGAPVPVACIANVSTKAEYRKGGLSSALLRATIGEAEARGCGWSFLFTGVPDFYAKLGWRNVYGEVVLMRTTDPRPPVAAATVDTLEDLGRIAGIHAQGLSSVPLAMVRGEADWNVKIPSRISKRLVALVPDRAYAVMRLEDSKAVVDEWAATEDRPELFESLLAGCLEAARQRGAEDLILAAPLTVGALAAVERFGGGKSVEDGMGMARPISADWSDERLARLFKRRDARFSSLDTF